LDLAHHADLKIQAYGILSDNLLNRIFFCPRFEEVERRILTLTFIVFSENGNIHFPKFCVHLLRSFLKKIEKNLNSKGGYSSQGIYACRLTSASEFARGPT
jgi:restriction endonuclease S subunit